MTGQVAIRKWGNSQGISIPKSVMEFFQWDISDTLQMETDGDRLILRKPFRHKTFEERLAEYGGEISTTDFDWGEPVGREVW